MISVEDWAEVRRLHRAQGLSIKEITRRFGVSRNTVRSAVRAEGPPGYERAAVSWAVDLFEPAIRDLLGEFPRMPATVIAEGIRWERSLTQLKLGGAAAPVVRARLQAGTGAYPMPLEAACRAFEDA